MLNIIVIALRRVALAMLVFGAALPASAGDGQVYTVGVIPSAPPVTMHALWKPLADRLGEKTGLEFRLKHYEKMAEFERDIVSGATDFIYSSPIQLMVAHTSSGYLPLVRANKPVAIGLFVRKDSPIRNLDDLTGKKISFVGNKNICSVAMQHLLSNYKKDLSFETEYAGSTRNVIINVLLGKSDAASIFIPEMDRESEETRSQLREVVETPEIASHPLSAHPRVPRQVQEAVKKGIASIAATADGAALLKSLRLENPVAADYDRDYRALEEIDVKRLTDWGK
jgi:phosphonate transport system substrate-binding protein